MKSQALPQSRLPRSERIEKAKASKLLSWNYICYTLPLFPQVLLNWRIRGSKLRYCTDSLNDLPCFKHVRLCPRIRGISLRWRRLRRDLSFESSSDIESGFSPPTSVCLFCSLHSIWWTWCTDWPKKDYLDKFRHYTTKCCRNLDVSFYLACQELSTSKEYCLG